MYYNTTHLKGEALKKERKNTESQEAIILNFFKEMGSSPYSPCDVHWAVLPNVPITSIRRAITNLTLKGFLEKTSVRKKGVYGKLVYCWKLKEGAI